MNLVILVGAVLSGNAFMGGVQALFCRFMPAKWWVRLIGKALGLGVGLLYLYFAGYYIMDKEANLVKAALVGLLPFVASLVIRGVLSAKRMRAENL